MPATSSSQTRSSALELATSIIQIANAEIPSIVTLIGILKSALPNFQSYLDDAEKVTQADIQSIQSEQTK